MKSRKKSSFFKAALSLSAFLLSVTGVSAEAWPQHSVKLVVPLGPASGVDVTARLLADHLSRRWGQAVVVENRPGADGTIGLAAFLGMADDHALLLAPTGTFTASPFLHRNRVYNQSQLAPIARVSNTLISIAVPKSLNVNSLAELMALVRSQPDRYHWASMTSGTDLVFSGFLSSTSLSMVRVPYRDGVVATNDLGEGRIEVFLSALATVLPQVMSGRIKILAVTNHVRAPAAPDVPTALEAGYPALEYDGLAGLFATDRMPVERRERIAADVQAIVADPAIAARIAGTGQVVSPGTPAEFASSIQEQMNAFTAIAGSMGLEPKQ
jgi:tripartite-type tricarboxylate transporter receptor subunit TctC